MPNPKDDNQNSKDGQISDKFILKSGMEPKGDQPEAIKKLVKGINDGKKLQTLLGATGTGKSVTADTEVYIYTKEQDQFTPKSVKIGDLIDKLIEKNQKTETYNDTEVLYAIDENEKIYVPSFNKESKKTELKAVTSFIRHESPKTLYKVKTSCGRTATFTGDHNFFVLRDGEIQLLDTIKLRKTDYIPLPINLEKLNKQKDLKTINLCKYLKVKAYINCREKVQEHVTAFGKTKVINALENNYGSTSLTKLHNIIAADEALEIQDFLNFQEQFQEKLEDSLENLEIHSRHGKSNFPINYPLSQEFLELLGIYLAEGCTTERYTLISAREKEFFESTKTLLQKLNFRFSVRKNNDIVIYGTILADLLKNLCGTGSFNKKLPDFWPQLSIKQLGHLLKAYFSGDGGVEKSAINTTTASKKLASEILYALSRFGIWGRTTIKFKKATNSDHQGNYYHQVSISGQENIKIFQKEIGFLIERKNRALKNLLKKNSNTNVDIIPGTARIIKKIRRQNKLHQKEIGEMAGLSRSAIGLIENNQRHISRSACTRLVKSLEKSLNEENQAIKELKSLLNLRWTPIAKVEATKSYEKYVYDFSVKDNETFLAGHGGMLVHNTFTMAKVVEAIQKPTLVLAHNKTLAAQLCSEFQEFFPNNAVSYFVSYYDYYQPEAYMPATDTYIEKDSSINEEIDKFRHAATVNLLTRKDVLIVASVSCIYGLGSVQDYNTLARVVKVGDIISRNKFLRQLTDLQYVRSNLEFKNGMFHVLGDTIEIFPRDRDSVFRIEFFDDEVDAISEVDGFTGELLKNLTEITIFPAKHDVTTQDKVQSAAKLIEKDLEIRYNELKKMGRDIEAQRIKTRTEYDLEILMETGYCNGIENYTRYLNGKDAGERPSTLMDYLPDDFLLLIDESHITVPQIGGMHNGNFSRKQTLIDHGFRLPSAHDNRPLRFEEFEEYMNSVVFVSATPGKYELGNTPKEDIAEQVVRPTGLLDPIIEVRPTEGQIPDLLKEIKKRTDKGERVLITTLTKSSSEKLTDFLSDADIRVQYLHSDIDTIERIEILRDLRLGKFDVLVGINLLREGLDLPEVSLVAILDADKRGFLRSASALIQTVGRCARNANGFVIMYADEMTEAMDQCIGETNRRREKQIAHNKKHGITPQTIIKEVRDISELAGKKDDSGKGHGAKIRGKDLKKGAIPKDEVKRIVKTLEDKMDLASQNLEFEKAAEIRDEIESLREEFGV